MNAYIIKDITTDELLLEGYFTSRAAAENYIEENHYSSVFWKVVELKLCE